MLKYVCYWLYQPIKAWFISELESRDPVNEAVLSQAENTEHTRTSFIKRSVDKMLPVVSKYAFYKYAT